jgi:hypothetical protein
MTVFGSQASDQVVMVDGMRLNLLEGSGQFSGIYLNDGMAQEIGTTPAHRTPKSRRAACAST